MNKFKKYSPFAKSVKKVKELSAKRPYLQSSYLWSRDCQSVAKGVAAGLAGSVIPGLQIFYAAILAVVLRGNLPIAVFCTFVTNPFTVLPVIYFIYFVGTLVLGDHQQEVSLEQFHWDFSSFAGFWHSFSTWFWQFGKAFMVGAPIVSLGLGVVGYFGTILIWKISAAWFRK